MLNKKAGDATMVFVYSALAKGFDICLGSAYIIAYLKQQGYTAEQYIPESSVSLDSCISEILSVKPGIVGFTVYNSNYSICRLIARALKEANPGLVIAFGGPTPTVRAEAILRNDSFVDVCIRNEGEEAVYELVSALDAAGFDVRQAGLEKIKGLSYRRDEVIYSNPDRNTFLSNRHVRDFLDKYPSPYLTGVIKSDMGIVTARGCNQHCTYCNCTVLSGHTVSTHSIERVAEELEYISSIKKDNSWVQIYDDAFTMFPNRALRICDRLIERGIKLPLACITRCDRMTEELLERMKEAGFKAIGFSLESAVPHVLRAIGKVQAPDTREDDGFEKEKEFIEKFKRYSSYARKIGIETVFASIMVGLPTETPEEARQTVEFIKSLGGQISYYAQNALEIYPRTPVFDKCEQYGIKLTDYKNGIIYKTEHHYDPYEIRMAPDAYTLGHYRNMNKNSLSLMSLSAHQRCSRGFFDNVIVLADRVCRELLLWLRSCLAVSGTFIQVYSSLEAAKKNRGADALDRMETDCITDKYVSYYREYDEAGVARLRLLNEHTLRNAYEGMSISLVNTALGLPKSASGMSPLEYMCIERNKADVYRLHEQLVELSNSKNIVEHLFRMPVLPYISGLCRWNGKDANCHSLRTAVIDEEDNIRPCWNGRPIGRVGMSFSEIQQNVIEMRRTAERERGCGGCSKKELCTLCIFPEPLETDEYCSMKRDYSIETSAGLLGAFDQLKDF